MLVGLYVYCLNVKVSVVGRFLWLNSLGEVDFCMDYDFCDVFMRVGRCDFLAELGLWEL